MKSKGVSLDGVEASRGARQSWPAELRARVARAIVERGESAMALSKLLGISPYTLRDWAFQYRRRAAEHRETGQSSGADRKRQEMPREADQTREAVVRSKREHPEQGTRRIRDELERFEGIPLSEQSVRRILHEEGMLQGTSQPVRKQQPEPRAFERAEPNQLWQSDIFTFLLRRHERLYVAAFMDDYSRYLVSVVMAHHQRSSLVMEALARGIAEYGAPREVLTDQGRQYVAWRGQTEFAEELRRQGIQHLKSRPHHPETLGKIERFWKTLWEEFLSRTVFADYADCERRVGLFVQAYNFRRPHQGIGGQVPADRFFRAAPQVREAIERGVALNAMALAKRQPARQPFYLVGRLGEQDLSIALTGSGIFVKLGDREQTIPVWKEASDEQAPSGEAQPQAASAADPEMAQAAGGSGSGGAGAVPDGAERAVGPDAGDRSDSSGGSVAWDVLPAGDAGAEWDAEGADAGGAGGWRGPAAAAANSGARIEAAEAGAGAPALGTAAGADAEAEAGLDAEPVGAQNQLDPNWAHSFAQIDAGRGDAGFEPDDWRGRSLSWERKLAGAEADGVEKLYAPAADEGDGTASFAGGGGGAVGAADGIGSGAPAGAVAESLPEPGAPWASSAGRVADAPASGSAGGALSRAPASRGEPPLASGERTAEETSGDGEPSVGAADGLPAKPASGTSEA
jgi:transposase InsO family protein